MLLFSVWGISLHGGIFKVLAYGKLAWQGERLYLDRDALMPPLTCKRTTSIRTVWQLWESWAPLHGASEPGSPHCRASWPTGPESSAAGGSVWNLAPISALTPLHTGTPMRLAPGQGREKKNAHEFFNTAHSNAQLVEHEGVPQVLQQQSLELKLFPLEGVFIPKRIALCISL